MSASTVIIATAFVVAFNLLFAWRDRSGIGSWDTFDWIYFAWTIVMAALYGAVFGFVSGHFSVGFYTALVYHTGKTSGAWGYGYYRTKIDEIERGE